MAKTENPNKPADPIKKPAELPQVSLGQVVGDTTQSITDLSKTVGSQNVRGFQLGASTLADFYRTDGRNLTLNPDESAKLNKSIADNNKKSGQTEKSLGKLQGQATTLNERIAAAEAKGNTKLAASLRKSLDKLTPKIEATQTRLTGFQTSATDAKTKLDAGGPSVSQIMRDANPETYAAVDRAQGFASKIGQTTAEGQRYLDAAAQGYRANEIGPNAISAAQIGRVADINSRDISAAQIGAVDNIRARQLAAAQTGVSGLGQNLMQTAQERLALGGNLSAQASRDAIQAARAGMAARGLGTGNSAIAAELLNRDRYSQQRFLENAGFAQGVEQTDLQRRLSNTQQTNAIAQANQDAALRASMANQQAAQARAQEQARLQQQAALANQQAALEAASRNQQTALSLGSTNAQLAQQASLANQTNAFNSQTANENARLAGSQQNLNFLGNAANYVDSQNRAGIAANVDAAALGQAYNPLNQFLGTSSQNVFGTNNLGSLTLGPAAQIGLGVASANTGIQQFNTQTGLQVDSFNANMLDSRYNSYMNNQAALRGAGAVGSASGKMGNAAMGAGVGMAGGAIAGAAMGSVVPGVGTLAGAVVGGALGAAGGGGAGYFCWVARAAWGEDNPRWIEFRESMLAHAPEWFIAAYARHGESIALHINTPIRRAIARVILSTLQHLWTPTKPNLQFA